MSAYYQKGRADATKGKFDPPSHSIFDSKSETEKKKQAIEEYREGYYDKQREMGKIK
jgi:hypothetical protein